MTNEIYGIDYLRRRLADKQTRVLLRYKYYEMKNNAQDFSSLAPGAKGNCWLVCESSR